MTFRPDNRQREPSQINAYLMLHLNTEPYGIFLFRNGFWQCSGEGRHMSDNAGQWVLPGTILRHGEHPGERAFGVFHEETGYDLDTLVAPIVITKAHRSVVGMCTCTYVGIGGEEARDVLETIEGKITESVARVREVALVNGIRSALGRLGPVSHLSRASWPEWLNEAFEALEDEQRDEALQRLRDHACHFEQCVRGLPRDIAFPESSV